MNATWGIAVRQLLGQSPLLIVYGAAVVYALTRWGRSPRAALLLAAGAALLLTTSVLGLFGMHLLLRSVIDRNPDHAEGVIIIAGFLMSAVHAAGVAMIVAAVFIDRDQYPQRDDLAADLRG